MVENKIYYVCKSEIPTVYTVRDFLSDIHFEDLVLTWHFIVPNAHALLPCDCFDLYACLAGIFIIISHYGVEKVLCVLEKQNLYSCDVYQCIINMQCNSCRWINKENLPPTCMYKVFI